MLPAAAVDRRLSTIFFFRKEDVAHLCRPLHVESCRSSSLEVTKGNDWLLDIVVLVSDSDVAYNTSGTLVDLLDRRDAAREAIGGLRAIFPSPRTAGWVRAEET